MDNNLLDCGHGPSPHESFTTGYGIDKDGRKHCYDCCAAMDLECLKNERRFSGYLSSDGKSLTNWPGRVLGRVVVTGKRHPWSRGRYYVSVKDVHGGWWSGVGAPGEYCSLRKVRTPSLAHW